MFTTTDFILLPAHKALDNNDLLSSLLLALVQEGVDQVHHHLGGARLLRRGADQAGVQLLVQRLQDLPHVRGQQRVVGVQVWRRLLYPQQLHSRVLHMQQPDLTADERSHNLLLSTIPPEPTVDSIISYLILTSKDLL